MAYERWLHKRAEVVESDLKLKHQLMRGSVFAFLRATFYRWASLWPVWGVLGGLAMWRLAIAMAASPRERRRLDYLPSGDGRWDDRKTTLLLCGC